MALVSFRLRLLLCFWCLLLLALFLPLRYYAGAVDRELHAEARSQAVRGLGAVAWMLQGHERFPDFRSLDAYLEELGSRLGMRVTYVLWDGEVAADSQVPFPRLARLDNHAGRPEVVQAMSEGRGMSTRHSDTLGRDLIYAARRFGATSGLPAGIVRVAIPVSRVQERMQSLSNHFLWVLGLTFAATILVSLLLTRSLGASIGRMAQAARDIGRGDYHRRIRFYPGAEFKPLVESINAMAENIEAHIQAMEEQRGELEAMFNGMAEGVMVLDERGAILRLNQALRTMFPDAAQGGTVLEATMRPELRKAVDMLLEGPSGTDRISLLLELAGERFVQVHIEPFRDQEGVRRLVLVFHDVSESRRLERMRRDFMANVSHELKTPLTSIKGYAETLLDARPEDPAAVEGFVRVILKNADHMSRMVSELLTLARTEHAGEETPLEPVNAGEALQQAVKAVATQASDKGIALASELPAQGVPVLGDLDALLQVFRNLLDNAVKYAPEGSTVTVDAKPRGNTMVFCVRDQGPGVPRRERERVFERFYRLDEHRRSREGGAGLGLSICRHIVRNHGGEIWVEGPEPESGAASGAAFCFTLKSA